MIEVRCRWQWCLLRFSAAKSVNENIRKDGRMRNRNERTIEHAVRAAIERPFLTGWTPGDSVLVNSRTSICGEDGEDRCGTEMEGWEIGRCLPFDYAVQSEPTAICWIVTDALVVKTGVAETELIGARRVRCSQRRRSWWKSSRLHSSAVDRVFVSRCNKFRASPLTPKGIPHKEFQQLAGLVDNPARNVFRHLAVSQGRMSRCCMT